LAPCNAFLSADIPSWLGAGPRHGAQKGAPARRLLPASMGTCGLKTRLRYERAEICAEVNLSARHGVKLAFWDSGYLGRKAVSGARFC
jgi:hypothetical protein